MELELRGPDWSRSMGPGERARFGRGGVGVDLVLADDPRLHRHCGTIVVDESGWEIENAGRWLRVRVVSVDRFGVDSVAPGERLRVPWPRVRVQVFAGGRRHEFTVRHVTGEFDEPVRRLDHADDGITVAPVAVNRATGYFRALVALCEPQLLDPTSNDAATDLEIARRLNRSGFEQGRVNGKAVERRLELCRTRFGLKDQGANGHASGLEPRDARRRLVELALLTGTVTPDDLALLEAVEPSRG